MYVFLFNISLIESDSVFEANGFKIYFDFINSTNLTQSQNKSDNFIQYCLNSNETLVHNPGDLYFQSKF